MKTRSRFMQYTLKALLILLPLLGIYVAWVMYQHEVVIRGVLGCAIMYLLFYYIKFSKTDLSLKETIAAPDVYNHLIFAFIGSIIVFWAAGGVFDMILFFAQQVFEFMR